MSALTGNQALGIATGTSTPTSAVARRGKKVPASKGNHETVVDDSSTGLGGKTSKKARHTSSPSASTDRSAEKSLKQSLITSEKNKMSNSAEGRLPIPSQWNLSSFASARKSNVKKIIAKASVLTGIAKHPLFTTFFTIALAGIITTYLLDLTSWQHGVISNSMGFTNRAQDVASLQVKLLSLDDHVRSMLPKLAMQLEVAHTRVDKLQKDHKELASTSFESFGRFDQSLASLNTRVSQIDPLVQHLVSAGGSEAMQKELEDLVQTAVKIRAANGGGGAGKILSLEDVRVAARSVMEEELARHAADGIAMADYALASGGGRVIKHTEAVFIKHAGVLKLAGMLRANQIHGMAQVILEPCAGIPGRCLPLKGNNGSVDIALRTTIFASEVTLDHISKRVAYEIESAPREFRLFGWKLLGSEAQSKEAIIPELLGEFSYSIEKNPVQTFRLNEQSKRLPINAVRLQILSNHGNPSHTCLYRFRIHGSPVTP